jgi:uncharacterized protein (TIGR02466 family)
MNHLIFPVFSSPIILFSVEENLDELNEIKNYKFISNQNEDIGSKNCFTTKSKNILDDFNDSKNIILKYFNYYKNDILKYDNTNFIMTTSWGTKALKNSYCHYHSHKNSFFSGVLYLDNSIGSAPIEFDNENIIPTQVLFDPSEWNIYNSTSWSIVPQNNMIIFFPSYLRHRIGLHKAKEPRYSIAFNFFPSGEIGYNDSFISIEHK